MESRERLSTSPRVGRAIGAIDAPAASGSQACCARAAAGLPPAEHSGLANPVRMKAV